MPGFECFPFANTTGTGVDIFPLILYVLYMGKPTPTGQTLLLIQKMCMFWDDCGTESIHRPKQALTIEHSFGLIRQCCAWEAERRSSAQAPLELFTATELPALRRQVPVRSLRRLRLLTSTYLLRDINARAVLWANGGAVPRNIT